MKSIDINKVVALAILFIGAVAFEDAKAQSCSGGTTTISSVENSQQIIEASDYCFVVTPTGSISPSIPTSQLVVTDSYREGELTGVSITNNGTISYALEFDSTSLNGIENGEYVTISSLLNNGIINVSLVGSYTDAAGILNRPDGAIDLLTNTGTIVGTATGVGSAGGFGINNGGMITTLNNAQGAGNSAGALTYTGSLPTNYNIIVNSPSSYGRLSGASLTGSTAFGIYSGSILSKGTYTSVLSGLTAGTNVSATSGMYNGTGWRLVETGVGTGIWDLIADYSSTNTLTGLQSNANSLATVYNQQAAAYQAALSYDCQVYDAAGLCVSVGGRYTYAGPSPSSNQQAGLVIVGYKPVQTFRIGAFADQSVNISTPSGFSQSKSSPMWGFFAKWHMNKDETGLGVQASA